MRSFRGTIGCVAVCLLQVFTGVSWTARATVQRADEYYAVSAPCAFETTGAEWKVVVTYAISKKMNAQW